MKIHQAPLCRHSLCVILLLLLLLGGAPLAADRTLTIWGGGKVLSSAPAVEAGSPAYGSSVAIFSLYNKDKQHIYVAKRSKEDSVVFSASYDKSSYPAPDTAGYINQIKVTYDAATQAYSFVTTGADPYIFTAALDRDLPEDSCILSFEYNCPAGIPGFQVFFGMPPSEIRSAYLDNVLPSVGTEWVQYRMDISDYRKKFDWGKKGDKLRLDFGDATGNVIRLRNFRFFTPSDADKAEKAKADSLKRKKRQDAIDIAAYLSKEYPSSVTEVIVGEKSVEISGSCRGKGSFAVADIAPSEDVIHTSTLTRLIPVPDSAKASFRITVPRIIKLGSVPAYDRALSKWAIVRTDSAVPVLASHAHYADTVAAIRSAARIDFATKKGTDAGSSETYMRDIDSLGIRSANRNIRLSSVLSSTYGNGHTIPYIYGGVTYYVNYSYISELDRILRTYTSKGMKPGAIILAPTTSEYRDPECTGGYYAMPDMTTPEAVNRYAAALSYLASRYTDGSHGRLAYWIMQNEVDAGESWTNMGKQPEMRYNDRYIKSLRLCYNIVRQYDQRAYVLGSYTHVWYDPSNEYSPRTMMEQNVSYSKAEGDFRWGVAYHPYPIDLTKPAFWKNDVKEATFSLSTRYITFLNPEVINTWILNRAHFYKGSEKRLLLFSEQGTNSPTYSDSDLQLQAAGAAWMWKKLEKLDGVDAMQWHAWIDDKYEFGLRIGLRAFADGNLQDYAPKPAWKVWQAAGTKKEDEVFAPYLKILGLSSWNGIIKPVSE